MITHLVLLELADTADVPAIVERLRALPQQIAEIRSYRVGPDLGFAEGNATIGIAAEFDDEAGWRAYQEHAAHRAVIDELIAPHRIRRAAVQLQA